jgi:Zn-dependent M28 family amino/carboxypeptidase
MMDPHRRRSLQAVALVLALAGCGASGPSRTPASSSSAVSARPSATAALEPQASLPDAEAAAERIGADLESLQAIADANDGIRAAGTPGYEASVDHAAARLRDIGFEVATPEIAFTAFRDLGSTLEVGGRTFSGPDEVRALIYSPGGAVSGRVVELEESGCQAADFDAVEPGDLALTTQGGCFRRDQVLNAVEAGAGALLIGYPGRGPGEIFRPTLIDPGGMDIPAVSVTDEAVRLLTGPDGDEVRLEVSTELPASTFRNVIAQLGDGPRVVMVGAHLDSVLDGPGINDNGSGVAAVLEIARAVAATGVPDGWALRIGLWGGEELGSIGSRAYAETVGDEVVAYLNLDMAGSVNGATLVYDEAGAAAGSAAVTDAFESALGARGEVSERTDLGGSSDHFGFQQAGIPTGGLFAGATATGGAAAPSGGGGGGGPAPDPCYHIGCDDLDNVDIERVVLFAAVTADVVAQLMTE